MGGALVTHVAEEEGVVHDALFCQLPDSLSAPPPHPQAAAERAKKAGGEALSAAVPHWSQFYQTDAISRASKVMAKCIKARQAPLPSLHAASAGN